LSRFGRQLRRGEHVELGQIIAFVGMTGLATGRTCTMNIASAAFTTDFRRGGCRLAPMARRPGNSTEFLTATPLIS